MRKETYVAYRPGDGCRNLCVAVPLSKSVAARALVLDFICGCRRSEELPDSDDSRELCRALKELRRGMAGKVFDLGSGGTSLRFFLALAASLDGFDSIVDCSEQLRRRPVSPLVDALRLIGACVEYVGEEGLLPVRVTGRHLFPGHLPDDIVEAEQSSQFYSALMLSSLLWESEEGKGIGFLERLRPVKSVSAPYIDMTEKMCRLAVLPEWREFVIERDWSAASYFYELALLAPDVTVRISGLAESSLQGDSECARIFGNLGVRTVFKGCYLGAVVSADTSAVSEVVERDGIFRLDMTDCPDLVPALAVGMSLAGIHYILYGIGHLRYKESDRLAVLSSELQKLGYRVVADGDSLSWDGSRVGREKRVVIDTHGDHRIAMAFAVAAVATGDIVLSDATCVSKSFAGFFDELEKAGFRIGRESVEE